jgi:mono/diheme cytochrome c family protein
MTSKLPIVLALAALVLSGCGAAGSVQGSADALAQGETQFVSLCASCHGVDGTGSDIAPPVVGHPAEAITAQVRNPEGGMPAFSESLLSDPNLELLVQYVLSLGGEETHTEIVPSEGEQVHLMAALEAIEDAENIDRELAINHLQQAMALASGAAAEIYAELIEDIESGKAGTARHELEELLGMMD